jgi:hypothetical protein
MAKAIEITDPTSPDDHGRMAGVVDAFDNQPAPRPGSSPIASERPAGAGALADLTCK